jgi:hypothetical protein
MLHKEGRGVAMQIASLDGRDSFAGGEKGLVGQSQGLQGKADGALGEAQARIGLLGVAEVEDRNAVSAAVGLFVGLGVASAAAIGDAEEGERLQFAAAVVGVDAHATCWEQVEEQECDDDDGAHLGQS